MPRKCLDASLRLLACLRPARCRVTGKRQTVRNTTKGDAALWARLRWSGCPTEQNSVG